MNIRKSKKNNGITLIALVITIIVMLILVAVTINMAINGGLFEQAGRAVSDTQDAINREQQLGIGGIIDQYVYNISEEVANLPTYSEELLDETTKVLTTNAKYISGNQVAVIPKGFKVIPGINGSMSIIDGLVITDAVDSEGNSIGNEFVWIPVTYTATNTDNNNNGYDDGFDAVFYRSAWDGNQRTSTLTTTSFPSSSMTWSNYTEPYASGYTSPTTESADYYEMMRSVQNNKGFYIGRYEAGIKTTESPRTALTTGPSNMVVQRDCYPYNYVGWGNAMNNYTDNVIYNTSSYSQTNGVSMGQGALYLSKHMYEGKDIGATSTLCYGIQWEAMLDFIKEDKNVTSSNDWGNYKDNLWRITRTTAKWTTSPSDNISWNLVDDAENDMKEKTSSESILLTTGADDSFAAKNIFDIAGNVYEWTNEANSSRSRVVRGGVYVGSGPEVPASFRNGSLPYNCSLYIGFRPALYIKEQ